METVSLWRVALWSFAAFTAAAGLPAALVRLIG